MDEKIETRPEVMVEEQAKAGFLSKIKIHKWKILGGILGVLVFAGAVFGAYKFGQRQIQPGPTPTPEAAATPTPDPTANWKTHTNKEMGFSFRFPAELSLQEFPISTISSLPTVIARLEHNNIQDYPLVDLTTARTDVSVEEWIKSKDDCPETFDSCTPMISGPIPNSVQFESINRHYGGIYTYFKKDDIIFDFALGVKQPNQPPKQNERQLYNQILSTFKFLKEEGSGQGTENWETYKNTVFGFEFRYPKNFSLEDKLPVKKIPSGSGAPENLTLTDQKENVKLTLWVDPAGFGPFFPHKTFQVAYSSEKGIYVTKETENDFSQYQDPSSNLREIMIPQTTILDGHNLFMYFTYNKDDTNKESLFKEILSTFRFLE